MHRSPCLLAQLRFHRAKQLAIELVKSLQTGGGTNNAAAMVISFAQRAQVVQPFTTDRSLLRRAIRSVQPTDLSTNLTSALKVIVGR